MAQDVLNTPVIAGRLKKLEMQGFKSFPDKTVIEFRGGITAIVGPNGSGKSNIADALRWVLGETSTKTLRGAKMEDVIFNGTKERKPMGYAEVSLYLDNSDRMFNLDYAELVITRRFYRSGDSDYAINKTPARLKDIRELFRDTGLGRDGYSVIGQGMITDIIKAKPTERRFLFEEAAGIAGLKFKKEESMKQVNATRDNMIRLSDILQELGDRLPSLEEKSKKAKRFLEYSAEKKNLELFVWQKQEAEARDSLAKATAVKKTFDDQLKDSDDYFRNAEERRQQINDEIQNLTVRLDDLRTQRETAQSELTQTEADILVLNNDLDHIHAEQTRISEELAARSEQETALNTEKTEAETVLHQAEEELDHLRAEINELCGKKDAAADDENAVEGQAGEQARTQATLNEELTSLRIRQASQSQNLSDLDAKKEETQKAIEAADEEIAAKKEAAKTARTEAEKFESIIADNRNRLEGYRLRFETKRQASEEKAKKLQDERMQLANRQSRLAVLKEMELHYEGFQSAVKTVLDEARHGVLKGTMVPVSDVIETEKEFAVAVEIALGNHVQDVITENESNAKSAMELLKSKNAGRATFLPLSAIKPQRINEGRMTKAAGYRGIASDLVECESRFRPAIDFLLGKTAVCDTVDNAIQLARDNGQSFKIVTLDGQVIHAGGSMTGGSLSKGTGVLTRKKQIEALEAEIKEAEKLVKALEEETDSLQGETDKSEQEIQEINARCAAAEQNRIRFRTEYESIRSVYNDLQDKNDERRDLLELLDRRKEELKAEAEKDTARIDEIIEAVAAGQENAKASEEKKRELREIQAKLTEKLEELREASFAREKLAGQQRIALEQIQLRITEQQTSGDTSREIFEANRKSAEEKQASVEQLQKKKTEIAERDGKLLEEMGTVSRTRGEKEAALEKMRTDEKDLYATRERLTRESERAAAKIESLTEFRTSILNKFWEEYELTLSDVEQMDLSYDFAEAKKRVAELKDKIRAMGHIDVTSIDEYEEVKERYENLSTQYADLETTVCELENMITELEKNMSDIFEDRLTVINKEFKETFKELFNGGDADLRLEEPGNILDSGVEIFAAPPGKIIKNLVSLSGGEQALTAIALYFAILKINPSPFCLLDEIEAALDDVNVNRYAAYLHHLSDHTQFVTITHRRGTMEEADKLYGVTMVEKGISRVLTVDPNEIGGLKTAIEEE